MAALTFADSHNMVAYLEKSEANADFAEIVDFLNASPISYALTVTVFNDEYDTPSHTKKVFANIRRKGKDFSGTVTPLFPSMLASQAVEGEGSGQPTEPQHTPTTASPSHVEPIPTIASSSHPKKTHKRRKTKSKVTEIPQSSEPTNLDADEAIHEERGDSVERAATTAASLDAEQDSGGSPRCQEAMGDTIAQTRSERVSTPSYDSPLLGVNTPGSDEERIKLKELMDMCTKLSDRVLDLENVKDAQALEIKKLKKRVKKLERKNKSRTPQPKRRVYKPRVESSEESLGEKDASKQGRNSDNTEELNVAEDEHMFDLSDLAGTKVVLEEEPIELVEDKAQRLQAELDVTERLQAEEREQILVEEQARMLMELIATRKKFFAAKRTEQQRNKPPTKAEQRKKICTYMKHIGGYKDKDFNDKSFDAIKQMFDKAYKQVNDFVPMDTESSEKKVDSSRKKAKSSNKRTRGVLGEESVKRQKVEDDAEKAELKACLEIVSNDDSVVNIESLATKYPIVDRKTHILANDIIYYQIIRADGSTKCYKVFSAMLDDFDRQYVLDLYRLVKERFETTSLEGYDRLLWGDLITLFEPSEEDEIWKTQQEYTFFSWKLYDSCGVHLLLTDTVSIHMLVEKKYPLTQEMLLRMLSGRLEVDHECEMAFELLRFTRSQLKK
ncbi:hypothetical protein Tco_0710658 [Tanacetum coccineum]